MKKPSRKATPAPTSDRSSRGRRRLDASFPAPSSHAVMPDSYGDVLAQIKQRIQTERLRVVLAANSAMVMLYWDIGRLILERQEHEGWGAKVIDRLSTDLREAYPDMGGLSPRNLLFMRSFAAAYPDQAIVKQLVSQLPWGHIIRLLCRSKSKLVVEYALRGFLKPIGVAAWQTQITKSLPKELQGSLPTVEEIEAELTGETGSTREEGAE